MDWHRQAHGMRGYTLYLRNTEWLIRDKGNFLGVEVFQLLKE